MISSETPYKLADIIRDTWPGLYRPPEKDYNKASTSTKGINFTKVKKINI